MKTIAMLITTAALLAPTVASATYMCDKRFAEVYGKNCPAGSTWDNSYHACITS